MNQVQIADTLDEIAVLMELNGENPFKVRAFSNAAEVVRTNQADFDAFLKQIERREIKGIGENLAEAILELHTSGTFEALSELKGKTPPGLLAMLKIPGLGVKKVKKLHSELGVTTLEALEELCRKGELSKIKGFGGKTEDNILKGITRLRDYATKARFPDAQQSATELKRAISESGLASAVEVVGSVRRHNEIVGNINLLVSNEKEGAVLEFLSTHSISKGAPTPGESKVAIPLVSGQMAELVFLKTEEFVPALAYFTGNKAHNTQLISRAEELGLKLTSTALLKNNELLPLRTEEDLYQNLNLAFIPPELREGLGEIEFAAECFSRKEPLPKLIESEDLKGILHAHSTYSDGKNTLREMAEAVRAKGYEYLGISDHSQSAFYAGGLKADDIKRQHEEIDRLNEELAPFKIFKGIESDILPDGALDYPEKVLKLFDFVIASIHAQQNMPEPEMTTRMLRAVENPYTTILGHPSARLLLKRDPIQVDLDAVIEAAARSGTAIELNANPRRFDLDWRYLKRARDLGIKIPISPDAHTIEGISHVKYGVGIARKGWLVKKDVLNTLTAAQLAAFFLSKRGAAK